jgi:hypothetical protein
MAGLNIDDFNIKEEDNLQTYLIKKGIQVSLSAHGLSDSPFSVLSCQHAEHQGLHIMLGIDCKNIPQAANEALVEFLEKLGDVSKDPGNYALAAKIKERHCKNAKPSYQIL